MALSIFTAEIASTSNAIGMPDAEGVEPSKPTDHVERDPDDRLVIPPDTDPEPPPAPAVPRFIIHVDGTARFLAFRGATGAPGNSGSNDVYGAKNQLAFDVKPIVVAGVRAGITIPDAKGWEQFGLRSSYETDRAFRSGGTISSSNSLASSLGVKGTSADLIDGALHVTGVGFEAEYATFTAGRVQVQDVATGDVSADAPLTFTRTRLEGSFDLGPYISTPPADRPAAQRDTIILLADYYSVRLPRIVYLTQDQPYGAPDANGNQPTRTTVVVETPPQPVTLALGAVGGMARGLITRGKKGYWAATLTGLFGAAHPQFDLPARLNAPMSADNRTATDGTALAAVGRVGTEFELKLTGDEVSPWAGGRVAGEIYYASVDVAGDPSGTVGFQDFFVTGQGFISVHFEGR